MKVLEKGCWGRCSRPGSSQEQEGGENWIIKNFIIHTHHMLSNQGWYGLGI